LDTLQSRPVRIKFYGSYYNMQPIHTTLSTQTRLLDTVEEIDQWEEGKQPATACQCQWLAAGTVLLAADVDIHSALKYMYTTLLLFYAVHPLLVKMLHSHPVKIIELKPHLSFTFLVVVLHWMSSQHT